VTLQSTFSWQVNIAGAISNTAWQVAFIGSFIPLNLVFALGNRNCISSSSVVSAQVLYITTACNYESVKFYKPQLLEQKLKVFTLHR
jgi:hypothetical protein